MSNSEHPVIALFHDELRQLQQTARSPDDIALWLVKTPLLARVSDVLCDVRYRPVSNDIPGFNWLEINSDLVITWGGPDRAFYDKHMKHYQVYSFIRYSASHNLNLTVVGDELAKAGLFIVADEQQWLSRELQEEMAMGSLFFSPAKWPFVAGELLLDVLSGDTLAHGPVTNVVRDAYPDSDPSTLITMVKAGLFDNGIEVCNWLLENEKPIHQNVLHIDPPRDF